MSHLSMLILAAALTVPPVAKSESPFACNIGALTKTERVRHFVELGPRLRALRKGVRELPDGYEIAFPGDPKTVSMLLEWAAQERLCCPFFDIDIRLAREGGTVSLRLTGREGTKKFIEADAAAWLER
jgi:hypothetical protein